MDSTKTPVTGLTFREACALREAAGIRTTEGADEVDDLDDLASDRAGLYSTRMWLTDLAIATGAVVLGGAQLVLAAAMWVITTLAPRAGLLAEWLSTAISANDALMDADPPPPTAYPAAQAPRPAPPAPPRDDGLPSVIDGEVMTEETDTEEVRI